MPKERTCRDKIKSVVANGARMCYNMGDRSPLKGRKTNKEPVYGTDVGKKKKAR